MAPGLASTIAAARAALSRPPTSPPASTRVVEVPRAPLAASDPYLGTTIAGRYRVLRKLGQGGMGVVYLAEHVFIEKKVALKILSEDFARKPDLVARFLHEARAASKIGHENIVDITDFGETASGSVFFAMEFLDGMDLAEQLRVGGAMPFERARHILDQIGRALAAAHEKGIIHRDLKPENVFLITREGRPDFVKILDFGIAKMSSLEEEGAGLTRTGMIFGTPEYMSPEQARGEKPDERVDVYAAGCILYEMLTGTVPFRAETFMGVLTKHMFEVPVPPSQRNRAVTPAVEGVVLKALSKDRERRFATMKDLVAAIATCDAVAPRALREAGGTSAARKGRWWLLAAVVILALVAGCLLWWWTHRELPLAAAPRLGGATSARLAASARLATSAPLAASAPLAESPFQVPVASRTR